MLAGCDTSSSLVPNAVTPPSAVPQDAQAATVERVIDGDTIWVTADQPGPLPPGTRHKIRLLEIDTPEFATKVAPAECGAGEATRFAESELAVGSRVYLAADKEDTDDYGRFLRYAWDSEGEFYNEKAVRLGFAKAVLFEPNDRYIQGMRAAEKQAMSDNLGIWGSFCDK